VLDQENQEDGDFDEDAVSPDAPEVEDSDHDEDRPPIPDGDWDDDQREGDLDSGENAPEDHNDDDSESEGYEEAPCVCELGDGSCCDGCHLKLAGVLCGYQVDIEERCFPEEGLCDASREQQIIDRVCSGNSAACDGPLIPRNAWYVIEECGEDEICETAECQSAPETCCNCQEGPCCSGSCRFDSSEKICESVGFEISCPWGNDPGSDVGYRGNFKYCSGDSSECSGTTVQQDWTIYTACPEDHSCKDGWCVGLECEYHLECPEEFYCRRGQCTHHENPCMQIPVGFCEDATLFCNEFYAECLSLQDPCESPEDCNNHPAGETCDPIMKKCRGLTNCLPSINNCYQGTACQHLNEPFGFQGDYCVNCRGNSDCYPGLHCEQRILYPDVCVP